MYRDLALKTFNRVFQDVYRLWEWDLKKVQDFVLNRASALTNKAEKMLFISALAELVRYEKRYADFRAMASINPFYVLKAELINEVYEWLLQVEIHDDKKKVEEKRWLADLTVLQKLADELVDGMLIEQEEGFVNLFLNNDGGFKVEWKQTAILLVYLFQQLEEIGLVSTNTSNKFIEDNFLHPGGLVSNVKQVRSDLKSRQNPPKNSGAIDVIIASLKPLYLKSK